MQGGNVVWRASGRNLEEEEAAAAAEEVNAEAKAALWEKANSHESLISTKESRGPVHPTFKSLGVIEPVGVWVCGVGDGCACVCERELCVCEYA
jgi:hypothetical protein